MKSKFLIFLLAFTCYAGKAQLIKNPYYIESRIHTGINMPFYEAINYLVKDNIYAFDISIGYQTEGNDYWEKLYNYPRTGAGFSYWTLGNDDVFGRAYAVYGFFNFQLFRPPSGRISLNSQLSIGGAYLTKRFDINDNHLNRAIGSHNNIYIRLGIDGRIKIFPGYEMVIEAGATHFSNGKTRSPNYGINAGTFSLGFNHFFNKKNMEIQSPDIPEISKRYIQSVIYSAGSKVYDNLQGKRYFFSSLTYNIERFVTNRGKIGLGADMFYDGALREALASQDGVPEKDISALLRFGLHASYAFQYKRISMGFQVGYYLYSRYTDLTNLYDRISIQYRISKNLLANVSIKSHYGKADFLEWGIGYSW